MIFYLWLYWWVIRQSMCWKSRYKKLVAGWHFIYGWTDWSGHSDNLRCTTASSFLHTAGENRIVHSTDCKTEQQKYSTFCKYQCACKCSLVKLSIYSVYSFNLKAQRLTQKCDVIYSVLCKTSMPPLKKWSVILL